MKDEQQLLVVRIPPSSYHWHEKWIYTSEDAEDHDEDDNDDDDDVKLERILQSLSAKIF